MAFGTAEYTNEQIKEIKEAFKKNDITDGYPLKPEIDLPPEKADIFSRTKKIFVQYWKDNLKGLGINQSMKNYSKDHPVNFLMNVDGKILSEVIAELYDQLNVKSDVDFIDAFCGMYQKPLMIGVEGYAKKLGKAPDDLADEELMFVIDKVAGIIIEETLKVVMIGQQVPELFDLSHKNAVIEDFNENQKENHPKIDFERKLYGLRRNFDCILSFEELAESDLVGLSPEDEAFEISESDFDNRTDLTSSQNETKLRTDEEIASESGESRATVQRYIRLTNLIPEMLDLMDKNEIAFSVGVELSYLDEDTQYELMGIMEETDHKPSYAQANHMHKDFIAGTLTGERMEEMLSSDKPNQKPVFKLSAEKFVKYIASDVSNKEAEDFFLKACDYYSKYLIRKRDKDAR